MSDIRLRYSQYKAASNFMNDQSPQNTADFSPPTFEQQLSNIDLPRQQPEARLIRESKLKRISDLEHVEIKQEPSVEEGYTEYFSAGSDIWGQLGHASRDT